MKTRHWLRRASRLLSNSVVAVVVLSCQPGLFLTAADSDPQVELECRIVSSSPGLPYRPWVLELRRPNGDPVFQALKGTGDSVRVKDLKPGIYQLCLTGTNGERCESVDLSLPPNKRFFRFKTRVKTPDATVGGGASHGVSVADLSIPKEARAEMARSEMAELSGDSDGALRHLERAFALHPNYPDALNNLGVHYYRARNYPKSIEYLRKATELSPNSYVAWANLASSVLASGNFKEALSMNKRALDLRPADARANMQLGLNFYYIHQYPEAKTYFEKAIKLDPMSASAPQIFLAEIAILERDSTGAERYIRDFLKLHPNSLVAPKLREALTEVRENRLVSLPSIDLSPGP